MKDARWPRAAAVLAAGVFIMAFLFVTALGGARIAFLYSRQPGFNVLHGVTQWAGLVAVLSFIVAGGLIAIPVAISPAPWGARLLRVIPALLLLFLLGGLLANILGIGTIGALGTVPVLGQVTFAEAWLASGAGLAVIALTLGAATRLAPAAGRAAALALGFTALASVVSALALVGSLMIVANNQPTLPNFGDAQAGQPGTAFGQRGAAGASGLGRQGAPGGGTTPFSGGAGEGEFEGARPGREGGPAGPGGLAVARQQYLLAGGLTVGLALLQVLAAGITVAHPLVAEAGTTASAGATASEIGPAVLAGLGVTLFAFGAMQLVPVSRANPPVQSTVQWDSAQTQQLWQRACADCHSNETQWPWYTAIAPASWLTAAHVNGGRERFDISQGVGSRRGAGEAVQQIRSGAMPPQDYIILHPAAQLSPEEKQLLIDGLQKSLGGGG